jgi:hypothetical protein
MATWYRGTQDLYADDGERKEFVTRREFRDFLVFLFDVSLGLSY